MRRIGLWLSVVYASCAGVGCAPEAPKQRLPLGVLLSVTGPLAEVGSAQLNAVQQAVGEINARGGVLGQELEVRFRNDGSDPDQAERLAGELVSGGATVLIGGVDSRIALRAAAASAPRAVFLSGSATSPAFTGGPGGFSFRTCALEAGEVALHAQRARARNLSRVAIVHPEGADHAALAEAFAAAFTRAGGTVTATAAYRPGEVTYAELLRPLLATDPEVVLLDADPVAGAEIVRDFVLTEPGSPVGWLFTHSVEIPSFVVAVGQRNFSFPHEGVGPGTPTGSRYAYFAAGFEAKYGQPPPVGAFSANVYDAVYLAAAAMEQAGSADPAAVRDALRSVSLGGMAYGPADYAALIEAIHQHRDVNYEGASGSVDLDLHGDTSAPYDVWAVGPAGLTVIERAVRPIE